MMTPYNFSTCLEDLRTYEGTAWDCSKNPVNSGSQPNSLFRRHHYGSNIIDEYRLSGAIVHKHFDADFPGILKFFLACFADFQSH
jgi:hypothetical protein